MNILGLTLNGKAAGEVTLRPSIPLSTAMICLDCSAIRAADDNAACPACGSESSWPLARWVDNKPASVRPAGEPAT